MKSSLCYNRRSSSHANHHSRLGQDLGRAGGGVASVPASLPGGARQGSWPPPPARTPLGQTMSTWLLPPAQPPHPWGTPLALPMPASPTLLPAALNAQQSLTASWPRPHRDHQGRASRVWGGSSLVRALTCCRSWRPGQPAAWRWQPQPLPQQRRQRHASWWQSPGQQHLSARWRS